VSKDAGCEYSVGENKVEEYERVWTHICAPEWERLMAGLSSGLLENKQGDVMALTIPQSLVRG
jgi:hypothetical protein